MCKFERSIIYDQYFKGTTKGAKISNTILQMYIQIDNENRILQSVAVNLQGRRYNYGKTGCHITG